MPFPFHVPGCSTWDEFGGLTGRLERAVSDGQPLTDLDWARVLFLTEVTFASDLIGSGLDFAIMARFCDTEAIGLLRGLQRKIGGCERANPGNRLGGADETWPQPLRRDGDARRQVVDQRIRELRQPGDIDAVGCRALVLGEAG